MIGRGSIGQPWIFREVKHFWKPESMPQKESFGWYLDVLKKQVQESVNRLDEVRGILHMRRHIAATPLFKGISDFKPTRIAMLKAASIEELFAIMDSVENAVFSGRTVEYGLTMASIFIFMLSLFAG